MKLMGMLLVVPLFAGAQTSPTVVTFNRADTEHCRVLAANGKPLLSSTYNGTTVAVSLPDNWVNGEYSLFVIVAQKGDGSAEVNPKEIYALFSDPAHTRFSWFDKKHDLETLASMRSQGMGQSGAASGGGAGGGGGFGGSNGDSSGAAPPMTHPEAMSIGGPGETNQTSKAEAEARNMGMRNGGASGPQRPQLDPAHPPVFLKHVTVKAGSQVSGYVFVRKPKGFAQEITANSMLGEIDIPVDGVVFRF